MSPQRQRLLAYVRACQSRLESIAAGGLRRLGGHDARQLTRDEVRDLGAMVSLCEHAVVLCARLQASLSDSDDDANRR